ncbi:MAG: PAS domain S-box protein [Bacillota bacterium]
MPKGKSGRERVVAEQQLLLDNIDILVWYLKDPETYGSVNQAFADFMGSNKNIIKGKKVSEFIENKFDLQKSIASSRQVFQQKEQVKVEEWYLNSAKDRRLLSITKTPKLDEFEEVEYVVCSARDVTSENTAKAKYEQSRRQYRDLVENVDEGIVIVDAEENFLYANSATSRVFGVDKGDMKGRNLREFLTNESLTKVLAEVEKRKAGKRSTYELSIVRPGGRKRLIKVNAKPRWQENEYAGSFVVFQDVTESREAEESLKRNKERYQSLLEAIPDPLFIIDREGIITDYVVDEPEKLVLAPEEFLHTSFTEILPEEKVTEARNILTEVFAGNDYITFEFQLKVDDKVHHYESRLLALSDEEALAIIRNITESKNMEQKLREEAERFKTFIKVSNTGAWEYNKNKDILWCSPEYFSMLGKDKKGKFAEDLDLKQAWIDLIHPEDKKAAVTTFQNYLISDKIGMYENTYRMQREDGGWAWILARGSYIYDENGNPTDNIVGTHIDVSELKQTEMALEESEKRYRAIFDLSPVGIMVLDKEGNIIEVNPAFAEMKALSREELEGSNIFNTIVKRGKNKRARRNIAKILAGGVNKLEIEEYDSDGEKIYFNLIETRIDLGDGEPGILSLRTDITERKKREERLELTQFSVDKSAVGVLWTLPSGEIEYVNEAICKKLDYTKTELVGRKISEIDLNLASKDLNETWDMIKSQGFISTESRYRTKQDYIIPVQVTSHYLKYDAKEYEVAYVLDISERKAAEQEIINQKNIVQKLHETALLLSECDEEDKILEITIEAAENILDFNICDISLVENDKIVTEISSEAASVQTYMSVPMTEGLAGKTYRSRQSFIVNDLSKDSDARPVSSEFKSALSLPIKDRGVFQAVATKKDAFNQQDLELAELLIAHMATALEQVKYKNKIVYKSYHDELTGTYNRRFFEEELKRIDVERQLPISIIMTDLNGLKIINDSYGHDQGDRMLIKSAKILQQSVREEDILARIGGDEFVLLLPKTNEKAALNIYERIKTRCEQTLQRDFPVSLGMGVATKTSSAEDLDEVFKRADNNMYQNKLLESRSTKNRIVISLLNTLGAKSDETEEHAGRMTRLAQDLGKKLDLSETELNQLSLLATLHDIGKTSVPEYILNKPGKLSPEEWQVIKEHPERGFRIASATEEFAHIAREILCHHERWDGTGYPGGLAGDNIPYLSRIIAIVDAFDVMINDRSYQPAKTLSEALQEIEKYAGTQFDPDIAKIFIGMLRDM